MAMHAAAGGTSSRRNRRPTAEAAPQGQQRAAEPDRLGHKPFRKVEMCEWRAKRLQNKSIKADSEPATKLIGPPARK